jgi:drug/metabolite transporter (DMT)-like permease
MRTALFLMMAVVGASGGELSVSRAMKTVGELHHFSLRSIVDFLGRALRVRWFWAGIALLALGFFSLLALLSWADVSFVIPATAMSYVTGALGARFLLGERLTPLRYAGIALVSAGVVLVSLSS